MGNYTPLIYLDEETEAELIRYIDDELGKHYAERGDIIDDLIRWQKDYWATPTKKQATFPFTGASTIVIPLSAIAVEAIHARDMTQCFALDQFVTAKAVSPDWDRAAQPFEKFFDRELLHEMKFRRFANDCFLEATKYGTMIGKVGYEKLIKTAVREIDGVKQEFDVTVRDGAFVAPVPLARFLMPHGEKDPQTASWCGEEHEDGLYYLEQLEQSGFFYPGTILDEDPSGSDPNKTSRLRHWALGQVGAGSSEGSSGTEFDRSQEQLEHAERTFLSSIRWAELYVAFDTDKSGIRKEIVVYYHRDSRCIMGIRYNWNDDLRRPYRIGQYFPVEHRWRGIGVCKQNEQFQREITIQHRQRLDNGTLANVRMIKVSKLSNYGPKEPIFPGKIWFVDSMDHVDSFQLAEIYPSGYGNEQSTLIYSNQRTGVNETVLGMPQAGTPGTATSDLARIQEANKKFDFTYNNKKVFINEIIYDVAGTIQQFGPRRLSYFRTAEGGNLVKDFFQMPNEQIREGLLLEIKAAGQQSNKIMDRQNWVQLAGLMQQYYSGLIQLAMPLGQQQIIATILQKGMAAATEAMRQIFETYDVRNIDRLLVTELEPAIQNGLSQLKPPSNGNGAVGTARSPTGMDQLLAGFPAGGTDSNGGINRIQGF